MRKTSQVVAEAFKAGVRKAMGNTMTDGNRVYLHGNVIAEKTHMGEKIGVTLAGWNTPTTRERVNAVLRVMGKVEHFFQKDFAPYFKHADGRVEAINSSMIFYV